MALVWTDNEHWWLYKPPPAPGAGLIWSSAKWALYSQAQP